MSDMSIERYDDSELAVRNQFYNGLHTLATLPGRAQIIA